MTAQTRANLKARFQTGDRPSGADFEDLIDSSVNLQDVSAQVYVGSIQTPGIVVSTVSADAVYTSNFFVSAFSVATVSATNANIATVTAGTVIAETVRASAVRHKNPYCSVHLAANNTVTLPGNTNYFVLSANISGAALGFTYTTAGRVTYTGSTTAAMAVAYTYRGFTNSAAQEFETTIFKNSAALDPSTAVFHILNTERRGATKNFILQMKTSDFLELNIKKPGSSLVYELTNTELTMTIFPVSFEF